MEHSFREPKAPADVLVRPAEASLRMPLEVGEHHQGIVVEQIEPTVMWSNRLPPPTGKPAVPSSSMMSTGQNIQLFSAMVSRCCSVV